MNKWQTEGTAQAQPGSIADSIPGSRLDPLIGALFWLYLLLLPLAHWLAPSGWLPLPNIPLMLAAALCIMGGRGAFRLAWRDLLLISLAVLALTSTLLNVGSSTDKSLNHLAALLFVTLLNYFVGGRILFHFLGGRWRRPLLLGFLFACALCVVEFVLVNFLDLPLPGFRPYGQEYDSTFILGVRPRSTFYESGHFAFYLACMVPLLVAAYWGERRRVCLVVASFGVSAFLLFSTSLFLIVIVWALMYVFMTRLYVRPSGAVLLLATFILLAGNISEVMQVADVLFLHKFQLFSFEDRQEKFMAVIDLVRGSSLLHVLFGYGMGSFSGLGMADSISSYANFLRDLGLAGLLLFGAALLPLESLNREVPRLWQTSFLYLGTALVLFFGAVPNYYFPHLAFALGLMSTANDPKSGVLRGSNG